MTESWADSFAGIDDEAWQTCREIWKAREQGLCHEDDTFGHLTLTQKTSDTFEAGYEGWCIRIHAEQATIEVLKRPDDLEGCVPEFYIHERIGLSFLRILRGCVLLHASCISTPSGCIALMAPASVGKSTLCGAMIDFPGIQIVAEDTLPVVRNHGENLAIPATSYLAMRHHWLDHLEGVLDILAATPKHYLLLKSHKCADKPGPLKALVMLNPDKPGPVQDIIPDAHIYSALLRQQMSISHSPESFKSFQFRSIVSILNGTPIYRMPVDLRDGEHIQQAASYLWDFCQNRVKM